MSSFLLIALALVSALQLALAGTGIQVIILYEIHLQVWT
jgi:hypothetical protein